MAGVKPINFGIIGLGAGTMNMIPELSTNPNANIVAAADTRKDALDRFTRDFGGRIYSNAEDLCKDPDVEVIYVMTPDEMHAEHAVLAAEHGKQVIFRTTGKSFGMVLYKSGSSVDYCPCRLLQMQARVRLAATPIYQQTSENNWHHSARPPPSTNTRMLNEEIHQD